MTWTAKRAALAVTALAFIHVGLWALPGPGLSPAMALTLFWTNLYVLFAAAVSTGRRGERDLGIFIAGYTVLFVLLVVLLDRKPLFILFVILYASVFRSRFLLGLFVVFVLAFVVLQPFAAEALLLLGGGYLLLWHQRKSPRFVFGCLALGIVAFGFLLLPLVHLALQDSVQTLWHVAQRAEVVGALWVSVISSLVATTLIVLFGVPLAYGLARSNFPGKDLVESLIDIPILIPQSVVGVSLMILLGPGSSIGQALEQHFGISVAGRFLGIVLAQVFVASPFLIKAALTAFESVPSDLEQASRVLGASSARTFWQISLPLASRGIAVGAVLAWARAISEFGAVVVFAGFPLSAPVLVHTEFSRAGLSESRPIAVLLLLTCAWIFVLLSLGRRYVPLGRPRPSPRNMGDLSRAPLRGRS